jgi:hypothetical protein
VGNVLNADVDRLHHLCHESGAQSGAVTLIQRFGSVLNLNRDAAPLHFHMLYLNGVYDRNAAQPRATSGL